jgi:hypothetical protein
MRRRPTVTASPEAPAFRFAWWMSFFATIALVAVLGLARSAQAATSPVLGLPTPALAVAPASNDEDNEEAEASEEDEFEFELCEEEDESEFCEAEEDDSDRPQAPTECLLTRVETSISAAPNRDRLRLQIRYEMSAPSAVGVAYGLHGAKGSLYLGGEKKQFGRKGVLRLSEDLTEAQMEKVMAAKGFTVRLRVPAAPRYCQSLFDRQLNVRQTTPTGLSWSEAA